LYHDRIQFAAAGQDDRNDIEAQLTVKVDATAVCVRWAYKDGVS